MSDKPELLRLAKFLTGSSDIEELIIAAKKLDQYSNASEIANTYQHPLLMSVQADIVDFATTLTVQHPGRGAIPFCLYDFQRDTLKELQNTSAKRIAIASGRQMGWTTMLSAHTLHYALNHDNATQIVCCPRFATAREFIQRIEFMIRSRPDVNVTEYSAGSIAFANGSKILARAAAVDAIRGTTLHKLVIMDAAYISHKTLTDVMLAMAPCMAAGSKVIMQSTPNIADDPFHEFCKEADLFIQQPWFLHPERDEAWKATQTACLGQAKFEIEYEAKFVSQPTCSETPE